jgi:F0F1-type ATP synthase assembly protein I
MSYYYDEGSRNPDSIPPSNISGANRRHYTEGQEQAKFFRNITDNQEREAKEREKPAPARVSKPGWFDAAIVLGLGIWILSYYKLLNIVLYTLLGLGIIIWLIVKRKGKWVVYGLLVIGLLAGLSVFSRWVERKMAHQTIQAEREQRKEEDARQIIKMRRADSILRANRAKYPSLRASRAKHRSLKEATKPHHSSRLILAEALGVE